MARITKFGAHPLNKEALNFFFESRIARRTVGDAAKKKFSLGVGCPGVEKTVKITSR
jgi:hypothetical protein